jgi:hypothetical protein
LQKPKSSKRGHLKTQTLVMMTVRVNSNHK